MNYEDLEKIEIEDFWDEILNDDTEIELDIDYINKAQEEARKQARKIKIEFYLDKFITEVIADVVENELKKAGL